jgi:hypothetical protein
MQSVFVAADASIVSLLELNFPQHLPGYNAENLFLFSFQQFTLRGPPVA